MRMWLILLVLNAGIPFAAQTTFSPSNGVYKVESFAGATADAKLNACARATLSGGVCDARGFGATTQTIAETVSIGSGASLNGYTAPYQKFLFSPATTFVPSLAGVQMFRMGIGAAVEGLHIYTGGVSGYAEPAIRITGSNPSWFHLGSVLKDTLVLGTTATSGAPVPAEGSACLALQSSSDSTAVAFASIENFACVGEYDGVLLSASGNGYINTNYFAHVTLYSQINSVELATAGTHGASITGNVFSGLGIQWGNLGFTQQYGIYQHGPGNIAPIRNNTYEGVSIWDAPDSATTVYLADGSSTRNYFEGYFNPGTAFTQIVDKSGPRGSNWINDINWANISGTSWRQILGQSAFTIGLAAGTGSHTFPAGLYLDTPVCTLAPTVTGNTYKISVSTRTVTVTSSSSGDNSMVQGICSAPGN